MQIKKVRIFFASFTHFFCFFYIWGYNKQIDEALIGLHNSYKVQNVGDLNIRLPWWWIWLEMWHFSIPIQSLSSLIWRISKGKFGSGICMFHLVPFSFFMSLPPLICFWCALAYMHTDWISTERILDVITWLHWLNHSFTKSSHHIKVFTVV